MHEAIIKVMLVIRDVKLLAVNRVIHDVREAVIRVVHDVPEAASKVMLDDGDARHQRLPRGERRLGLRDYLMELVPDR